MPFGKFRVKPPESYNPETCHTFNLPEIITKYSAPDFNSMFLAFTTGVFLWMIYGFLINDTSIIITNILTFTLALTILIAKIKFK